ncbi:molybdate ABC transporter substrate-binding protein [Thermomonospora umbrina]|uniref:Molybdate transport system substrate-binding protein n=1 Tax=Thermomonospora umbrina TaxID=111806 RepID=A0A3D9T1V9_9ACTN|nr:molybdate ABC transporter substrate-binding protein [Thermomonospora umbrina]REE99215.1 molybdate transport system substrate-binding protein [Thermomonospora umbrina]
MPPRPLLPRSVACVAALLLTPGCGGSSGPVTLTVFATSALTEALTELGGRYGRSHDVRVRFVFGGSSELVERLRDRQRADVLVTGDETAMQPVADDVGRRRVIARNSLTIAVAPGNPAGVRGLTDLGRPGLRVVLGSATSPVGRYARRVLDGERLAVRPVSEEIGARSVLTRIRTGEADAGIVYITDMRSAGAAASSVAIPADQNTTVAYPAAALVDGDHEEAAEALIAWLGSAEARGVLHRHGFASP